MILTELIFLSIITIVNAVDGRCYLCSQETLTECVGSNQPDSSIYITVLQYYTEPCNGQCVLFRNENRSIIRGCSWTYGHMTSKSIGWHELSPGINAYFCDSHLCNNGTYEQPEISMKRTEFISSPQQELFILPGTNPLYLSRQLHQCYSCTARFQGCGEFLDFRYASNYIRTCPTSCIIFRNPNDLNLITRDCSIFWPQAHAKIGLHKLLGSDAFFCQQSLCNGISFDFIMGIFHNQLPAVIRFPPVRRNENSSTTTATTTSIDNDNTMWDDPDLDVILVESTTLVVSNNFTNSSISNDYLDKILPNNNTIVDDLAIENDTTLLLSSTVILSTIHIEEDEGIIPNTTSSIQPITRFEHLSVNDNSEEINQTIENDDYILSSITPMIDLFTFLPDYFLNNKTKNQFQTTTTSKIPDIFYEYCKNKPCHHGGHLNSDCLCICLPTLTGDNCETVLCEEEPADICAFILEHECQINHIQYLCPKFCQIDICSSREM